MQQHFKFDVNKKCSATTWVTLYVCMYGRNRIRIKFITTPCEIGQCLTNSNQIVSLERRVPAEEVKISFKWHCDAFKKGSASVQSLAFERACIMFNLAAREN